jgi:hypothetical protein
MATTDHLPDVFDLEPAAWSPRPAVYAVAVHYAQSTGRPIPSNREVFAALRHRGFTESTRKGVHGFNGIQTTPELAHAPRLARVVGTATAYKQGDRTDESRAALRTERTLNRWTHAEPGLSTAYDPWTTHTEPDEIRSTPWDELPEVLEPPVPTAPTLADGYSASTRITHVLVSRTETRWGPTPTWRCVYCHSPATTVDHFQPWEVTHDSRPANLVPCCTRCQLEKGARRPAEWDRFQNLPRAASAHLQAIASDPHWTAPHAHS